MHYQPYMSESYDPPQDPERVREQLRGQSTTIVCGSVTDPNGLGITVYGGDHEEDREVDFEHPSKFPQMAEDHLAWLKGTPSPIEEDADNTLVIIVNGPAQSGKDTLSEVVRGHFMDVVDLPRENAWAYNLSTVDKVKETALESFGWDGVKDERGRKLLWNLKNIMTEYNDGVYRDITDRIDRISKRTPEDLHLFVIHSREPDEIERFQIKYPCSYSVYINRPAVLQELPPTESDDPDIIENYPYDFYLDNETTLEAFEASCQFMIEHILTVEGRCKPV